MRELVVIGAEEIGKTTLANALMGWDYFPQSYEYVAVPTTEKLSRITPELGRITDTPGYSLLWYTVPEDTLTAVAQADTVVVLLNEELASEDVDIPTEDPDWEAHRAGEAELLRKLFKNTKTRDIYFVIPYDHCEWPEEEEVPLSQAMRLARKRFSQMTDHGEAAFFCVDPMKALIGAIEADDEAIEQSGILPLKAALMSGNQA